ncbi:MAG: PglZ domain-containing protein [Thermodesulfobacteriota bacterium]|jgi:hypothetical protein
MHPSTWVKDHIEALTRHHHLVWVEDPYHLLEDAELSQLEAALQETGHRLYAVDNALRLRELLNGYEPGNTARLVIVDQSYTLRDPHLLPKDAKPADLCPLPAPDWKPLLARDALFRPTVRDFLVAVTGEEDWPGEVNIYPYEKLAREHTAAFVRAYETFRRTGRPLATEDLILVGASAVLGVDLFDITSPLVALELAFHSTDRWDALACLFNAAEQEVVRRRLQTLPRPCGDLFGDNAELARSAVVALLVLKQHFGKTPGTHLRFLSPALASYRDCDVLPAAEVPSWFVTDEVPRFEKLCGDDFLAYLRDTLKLADPGQARTFAQRERLSAKLRSLVPFDLQVPVRQGRTGEEDFRLEHLVPEFLLHKADLEKIVHATRAAVEHLRLVPVRNQTAKQFLQVFLDREFYRVDRLLGRLESLIYFVEGPARHQWAGDPGFTARWAAELRTCRDTMALAGRLRDDLDLLFGKLLEARYADIVPAEVLPTDLFYEKFIAPRRRTAAGAVRKAVVLVIDSMRIDIWREVVRPALERDYEVEESVGFALLPSETRVSRRAFFVGKPPALVPSAGKESYLFAELLSAVHETVVEFEDFPHRRPGMAFGVRSRDRSVHAAVFDFPDVLSHEVDWDPHTLHEGQRPLVREIRALLEEVGPEALVFITADHGHILQDRGAPVRLSNAEEVGYRSAYVKTRVEGFDAAHVFQIPARTLRHSAPGWYVFPRPGYALRDEADERAFRPKGNYRHGGLSLFEMVVPLACLKHRAAPTRVQLAATVRESVMVGHASTIHVSVSADGVVSSSVAIVADSTDVEAATVSEVTTTPKTIPVRFVPSTPGRQTMRLTAHLGGEKVGETTVDVMVAAALSGQDVARAKLVKLFGED